MPPISILMLIFSGMLLIYAALLAITKDINLLPLRTRVSIKKKGQKQYIFKLGKCVAVVGLAPAVSAIVGFWSEAGLLITLAAGMIIGLWLSTRIMKDEM